MWTRRSFLGTVGTGLLMGPQVLAATLPAKRRRLAVVTTEWRYHSHAWHMAERFLVGYPINGRWHRPPLEVVSAYVDQTPKNDLSRKRAEEFGFTIYPDDRRGAALRRRQAGRRCRADHRRARQLPEQRVRPDEVSALRVLQAGGRRLPQGRPDGAGLQRQAPVLELGVGQGDGRDRRAS